MKKVLLLFAFVSFTLNAQTILMEENFDVFSTVEANWTLHNVSEPIGTTGYSAGDPLSTYIIAHSGADDSYIAAGFNNASDIGTISNWLITPTLDLVDGDVITFYTRTISGSTYPDRLEARISTEGDATVLPANENEVGSFTTLIQEINPSLATGGYPEQWTEFSYTVSGITSATPSKIAFRYFVTDAGINGSNSNYIGIDTFSVVSPTVSVDDLESVSFYYFPNPASSSLTMKANSAINEVIFYNILGEKVLQATPNNLESKVSISHLSPGAYFVQAQVGDSKGTFKFIKR